MTWAIPVLAADQWLFASVDPFWKFYADNLRGSLFSGFLTLTGFLFAVKTFLVINMKKELYDTDLYRERIWSNKAINEKISVYGPLRRLSSLLLAAVLFSIVTAVAQLALGCSVQTWWAATICLTLAVLTLLLLVVILVIIRCNLTAWFELLEGEAVEKRKKKTAASQPAGVASPTP